MAPSLRPLPPEDLRGPRHSNRPVRATRSQVNTYREDSDEREDGSDVDELDSEDSSHSRIRRRPLAHRQTLSDNNLGRATVGEKEVRIPKMAAKPRITRASSGRAKRALFLHSSPRKRKAVESAENLALSEPTISPPWSTLPYQILVDIFSRAAPIGNITAASELVRSIKWLLGVSRLCRGFFEPAMAALFASPPVNAPEWTRGLTQLLAKDQDNLSTNYRNKVKCLDIDGHYIGIDPTLLNTLLSYTPQVKHLCVSNHGHSLRRSSKPFQILFLDSWFECAASERMRLRSWQWSYNLPFDDLKIYHLRPMFQSLRTLYFYRISPRHSHGGRRSRQLDVEEEGAKIAMDLASALCVLPHLRRVVFCECPYMQELFSVLSVRLEALSIISCEDMDSSALGGYLINYGDNLRVLKLEQNREINMSFTTDLRAACPRLEVFVMDLDFPSLSTLAHDVEPYFDNLLFPGETPSWPRTLQRLELNRLRKWDIATAEAFFNSLIDAAPYLKDLRYLMITAILKIDWRGRAQFREEWVRKFEQTFARKSTPPSSTFEPPYNGQVSQLTRTPTSFQSPGNKESTTQLSPRRKSRRLAERRPLEESEDSGLSTDVGSSHGYVSDLQAKQPSTNGEQPVPYIQGMCDVVKIRIDNLRPADVLLKAENLSDGEVTWDEDWEGEDLELNGAYAW